MKKILNITKMTTLIPTNTLEFEEYTTDFFTEKVLKDYLIKEAIPCLSCRFKDPKEFYENILFKIPKGKEYKDYFFIYSHLVKFYPHDYLSKKELAKKHDFEEHEIIAEGSVKLMDTAEENAPLVRWMIVKN